MTLLKNILVLLLLAVLALDEVGYEPSWVMASFTTLLACKVVPSCSPTQNSPQMPLPSPPSSASGSFSFYTVDEANPLAESSGKTVPAEEVKLELFE